MNRKIKSILFFLLIFIGFIIGLNFKMEKDSSPLKIVKWNNFYDDESINLYYGCKDKDVLNQIREKFNLNTIIGKNRDDFDKSMKIIEWINKNIKYKEELKNSIKDKGVFDILQDKNKKTFSNEEICTIFNEFSIASGSISRIGEFTISSKAKSKDIFNVCEVWSDKFNKWIMIDPSNGCYICTNKVPLSGIEVLKNRDNIDDLQIVVKNNKEKHIKKLLANVTTYTIKIDNTIYSTQSSNCYIGFVEENNIPVKVLLNHPVALTTKDNLFNLSPKSKIKKEDKIPTLIFFKRNDNKNDMRDKEYKDKGKSNFTFVVGVFQNSSMVNRYYISINNGPFIEKRDYFDLDIQQDTNSIRLSRDKKNVDREVIFQYKVK